jgi:response regulator of citrate/malate metabolism
MSNVTTIAVSADSFESVRQKSFAAGCDDFIAKPVQIDDLLECIDRYLGLNWIYEKIAETEQETETLPLIAPSENELIALQKFAQRGSITSIWSAIARIKELDSKFIPFAVRIDQFAENFEFEKIQDFIKHFLIEGKE